MKIKTKVGNITIECPYHHKCMDPHGLICGRANRFERCEIYRKYQREEQFLIMKKNLGIA